MRSIALSLLLFTQVVGAQPTSSATVFSLSEQQVSDFEKEALAGSAEKARRLYDYYAITRVDLQQARAWLIVCAENGEPVCQYNLGFVLNQEKQNVRSVFWLTRSLENGNQAANDLLKEIRGRGRE
ncbi:hypothetical protein [Lysobacter sp. Root690]|uniref:hypothetical protein n=1 Tax=Lysobacter sp. Root690 TaxID=1736588 RepID=UPI0012FB6F6C|nr:hypothetical protein [Lysobacter sp. Root690]